MEALIRRLARVNAGASLSLALIFVFLLLEGANSAAHAALLSCLLLLFLIGLVWTSSRGSLCRILGANWLSALAALAFLVWGVLTILPAAMLGLLPHPAWPEGAGYASLSLSPYRTLEGLAAFLAPCAAFLIGAMQNGRSEARDWSGRWALLFAVLYALIGLQLYFAGVTGPRLDVAVGSANVAAATFAFLSLIALALMARAARGRLDAPGAEASLPKHWRWAAFAIKAPFSLALFVFLFSALLLTQSRGGLIAALAGYLIFAGLLWSQSLRGGSMRGGAVFGPLFVTALIVALLFLRGGDEVMARFGLASEDIEVRRMLAETHWQAFLERPWLGHGLNTYHEINQTLLSAENWRALSTAGSAHNIFVQTLEETGVVGLVALALMLAPLFWRAFARLAARGSGAEWAAAALAGASLFLLQGLVDFTLQTPAVAALFAWCLGAWVGRGAPRAA